MTVLRYDSNGGRAPVRSEPEGGLRPSVVRLLALVDPDDAAWTRTLAVLSDMTAAGVDLDEAAVVIAVKLGKWEWSRDDRAMVNIALAAETKPTHPSSIVYYVRRGDLIKIGTTKRPHARFVDLLPDEILAFEPGGHRQESMRHRQFSHLRLGAQSEYFDIATELTAHIERTRAEYGDPDPAWPTSRNIAERARLEQWPTSATLAVPASLETVTVLEGAERLGISDGTVRGWIYRGRLQRVGDDDCGHGLYYYEHMTRLRDRHLERVAARERKKIVAK